MFFSPFRQPLFLDKNKLAEKSIKVNTASAFIDSFENALHYHDNVTLAKLHTDKMDYLCQASLSMLILILDGNEWEPDSA